MRKIDFGSPAPAAALWTALHDDTIDANPLRPSSRYFAVRRGRGITVAAGNRH
jgi:hypothetical protein